MVALAGRGWALAPCLRAMFDEADRRWPKRSRISDGSIGDQAHASRTSDHNPDASGDVLAGDLTDDKANGCDADLFAEHLRKSRDPRVKYVISNGRVFRSYGSSAWQWTPYTGANGHFSHTHVSVLDTPEAKSNTSAWFPYADAALPEDPAPAPEEDDVYFLFRIKDKPEVWLCSPFHRRHMKSQVAVDQWKYHLGPRIANGGAIQVVEDAAFVLDLEVVG